MNASTVRALMATPDKKPSANAAAINAKAYYRRGASHSILGNFDEARADLAEAVALAPEGPRGHVRRGAALEVLRRFEEAAEAYRQALRGAPRTSFDASLELMLQHALREAGDAAAPPRAAAPGPQWSGLRGAFEPSGGASL